VRDIRVQKSLDARSLSRKRLAIATFMIRKGEILLDPSSQILYSPPENGVFFSASSALSAVNLLFFIHLNFEGRLP
jgi:hypothetical protein